MASIQVFKTLVTMIYLKASFLRPEFLMPPKFYDTVVCLPHPPSVVRNREIELLRQFDSLRLAVRADWVMKKMFNESELEEAKAEAKRIFAGKEQVLGFGIGVHCIRVYLKEDLPQDNNILRVRRPSVVALDADGSVRISDSRLVPIVYVTSL